MMRKYFAIGFIALTALVTCHSAKAQSDAPSPADRAVETPKQSTDWQEQRGTASYYGPRQNGRRSANGAIFDQRLMTAAHPWLPFGTRIRVTLAETGRSVIVTITDRLFSRRRIIDLSVAAARELGMIRQGIAEVRLSPG